VIDLTFESVHNDDIIVHPDTKVSQEGAVDWKFVVIDKNKAEQRATTDLHSRINGG
jgi:hypothetical protein